MLIHTIDNSMFTCNCWTVSLIRSSELIQPGNKGLTMHSMGILHRPRGIISIKSTKIRWFLRKSSRGGWSLLSEAKSLNTTQVRSSGLSPQRFDVFCDELAVGWAGYPVVAQGLYSLKLKPRGTMRIEWWLDGRLDQLLGGQRCSKESWRTTLGSKGI